MVATVFETLHKSKLLSSIALDRLGDYLELLRVEMKIQGRDLGMHLLGYAIAGLFGLLAVIFVGVAIILTFWDSPHRTLAAWGVVVLYLAAAGAGMTLVLKPSQSGSAFSTLRNEIKRDVDAVKESI
jgi:uncharacterized membrane protein YqjE